MKKLLTISLLLMLALWSCGSEPKQPSDKQTGIQESEPGASGEIIDRYVKTLTTAQDKARAAGERAEERTRKMQEAIGD